jgi:hypothetical protein
VHLSIKYRVSQNKNPRLVTEGWGCVQETGKLKFALPSVWQGGGVMVVMQGNG